MGNTRFSYSPLTAGVHTVGLAGDFSEWQILPMLDFGGVYLLALDLPPGRYRYKFIVDGNWIYDESNLQKEPDGFGGYHSLLLIEAPQSSLTWEEVVSAAQNKKAGDMIKLFRSGEIEAELRFFWFPNLADTVNLYLNGEVFAFHRIGKNALYDVFHIFIGLNPDGSGEWFASPYPVQSTLEKASGSQDALSIHIEILYLDRRCYLDAEGFHFDTTEVVDNQPPILVDLINYEIFTVPEWVSKSVIYQIFPDRFCNGDKGLNPDFSEWYYDDCRTPPPEGDFLQPEQEYFHLVQDWNDISGLTQSPFLENGKPDWWSFYGGDIPGVLSKLDYLTDLGINTIYFNPLWQAKSNHKYDSADYHSIDPHFGTIEQMTHFVNEAHSRGIRIVLDVAFNHTGETFWAFRDCVEKGPESKYWTWYDWKKWPLPKPLPCDFKPKEYYQCWWGIKDMPDLNYDLSRHHPEENAIRHIESAQVNKPLIDYLMDTIRWWLLDIGIDGFRLDVPDEVPFWFWQMFRTEVKKCKPEAWIVGEIWYDADKWVNAKYFDSVMNYAYLKNPVIEYFIFNIIDQKEFIQRIETGLAQYPFHALKAMMNLLGSHDTLRIYELAKGEVAALKLAILFVMCFPGAPHIYYGDEIALPGGKDPDNRRPFNWDWEASPISRDLRIFYRSLIALRRNTPALTDGNFAFVPSSDGLLRFTRSTENTTIYVLINHDSSPHIIQLPDGAVKLFGQFDADNSTLPPQSALILSV
jgi:glycosidase